jgi:hypothetical protein
VAQKKISRTSIAMGGSKTGTGSNSKTPAPVIGTRIEMGTVRATSADRNGGARDSSHSSSHSSGHDRKSSDRENPLNAVTNKGPKVLDNDTDASNTGRKISSQQPGMLKPALKPMQSAFILPARSSDEENSWSSKLYRIVLSPGGMFVILFTVMLSYGIVILIEKVNRFQGNYSFKDGPEGADVAISMTPEIITGGAYPTMEEWAMKPKYTFDNAGPQGAFGCIAREDNISRSFFFICFLILNWLSIYGIRYFQIRDEFDFSRELYFVCAIWIVTVFPGMIVLLSASTSGTPGRVTMRYNDRDLYHVTNVPCNLTTGFYGTEAPGSFILDEFNFKNADSSNSVHLCVHRANFDTWIRQASTRDHDWTIVHLLQVICCVSCHMVTIVWPLISLITRAIHNVREKSSVTIQKELYKDISVVNHLDSVLREKELRDAFKVFCNNEYSFENLAFWLDIEEYKKMCASETALDPLKEQANTVYETYLMNGAQFDVQLPADILKVIENTLINSTNAKDFETIYDAAQSFVFKFMEEDSFQRFKTSTGFQTMKRQLEKVMIHDPLSLSLPLFNQICLVLLSQVKPRLFFTHQLQYLSSIL